ncbi:hypothetical protein M758_1G249900 [Ceratodon purpureus]|uniref:Pectinesterase n=1 Tax=Ceratodon purpureus TaxID=3225 RepID=A0A8T0JC53_CERPU|nr:hypothetical protein KC19_1G256400 [Ceratodon purpureus]KAG0631391.1 hypothetical protein M758_1G249900 [Ceratodon purpureus]
MAPYQRMFTLWSCLLMVLSVDVCSARGAQDLRSVFTGHTKFAKEHRLLDLNSEKKSASTHDQFAGFKQTSKNSVNKVGSGGNHFYVSRTGTANFNRIQDAIDNIPEYNEQWVQIDIAAGVYHEKVIIPYNKPFISLQGAGLTSTTIINSETASKSGTADSATFTVWAPNFVARGIGFVNAAPPAKPGAVNGQAVAVLLAADKAAFYGCGMYGGQDTLFDYAGRHYFKDCYISGTIDFIFGNAKSVFKNVELHAMAQDSMISGSLTAQKRSSSNEDTGFVFIDCKITGTGKVYLGRAWGPYSRTVYINTYMENIIIPEGWQDWGSSQRQKTVYYGQFQCSGPGSDQSKRVAWSHELSDSEASQYMQLSWIDGQTWLPQT